MHTFDEPALFAALEKLPTAERVAFAFAAAMRVQKLGHELQSEACRTLLANARHAVAAYLLTAKFSAGEIARLSSSLDELPELDDDQVAASAYMLRCVLTGEAKNALWAARRAYDAADQRAQDEFEVEEFSPTVEKAILSSQVVQSELRAQANDLSLLQTNPHGIGLVCEQYQLHV
ncbi:hypothetical protein OPU71_20850 [Niveibacterium sp. 24ML]|uniref:hypothetical protein n=1 Tax=Niveibacterium sp. 24ML TaxID=2985512 RepID=UPI00226F4255|nr:hypothetical protein [Niveibacterium sp. 24ML]MCX9158569.1 hypothetical protein [Niveibacterium sp. 24ML]